MREKVTNEIGDEIRDTYQALRRHGVSPQSSIELIQSHISEEFNLDLGKATIQNYSFMELKKRRESFRRYQKSQKGVVSRKRSYQKRVESEEFRESERQRHRDMKKPRNEEFFNLLQIFSDDSQHTTKDVWDNFGGSYNSINRQLNQYARSGIMLKVRKGNKIIYRLNPKSKFYKQLLEFSSLMF